MWNSNCLIVIMQINPGKNRETVNRKRIRIVLLSVAFVLLVLIGVGFSYWNTNKNLIIENKLEKAIAKSNDGLPRVHERSTIGNSPTHHQAGGSSSA